MREGINNDNKLFGFVTIWIKVLLKMLIKIRGKYYRRGGGAKCKNPQGYTMKNQLLL